MMPAVLLERGISVYSRPEPRTFFGIHGGKTGCMYDMNSQLQQIGRCFVQGLGIRATAKCVGCSRDRVAKLYKILRSMGRDFRCACGRDLAHRGNCIARAPRVPRQYKTRVRRSPTTTHCPAGHPYEGANLLRRLNGTRRCRQCRLESDRASRRRRNALKGASNLGRASVVLAVDKGAKRLTSWSIPNHPTFMCRSLSDD